MSYIVKRQREIKCFQFLLEGSSTGFVLDVGGRAFHADGPENENALAKFCTTEIFSSYDVRNFRLPPCLWKNLKTQTVKLLLLSFLNIRDDEARVSVSYKWLVMEAINTVWLVAIATSASAASCPCACVVVANDMQTACSSAILNGARIVCLCVCS